MKISRIVIKNFRSFERLDLPISTGTTCVIGENNTGKTNLLHAIRLCLDANLSSSYRSLIPSDIHSDVNIANPIQVIIGVEIIDFEGVVNEEALVGGWQSKPGLARLFYRFRPKTNVREDLASGEIEAGSLTMEDYHWEISGGGDPDRDLADIDWNENIGAQIRFSDLQSFLVVLLPALRDVESDLRQFRASPLARLINAMEIDQDEQEELLDKLREANDGISGSASVKKIADAIDESFNSVAGSAFGMDVSIGVAEPSFVSVIRTLRILMSNNAMDNFDPSSNGLGLNNILYVSILIEYFKKRLEQQKSAGQIILFEEPEAHLHPQLQLTLFNALCSLPFQTILTTHSTHITSQASIDSYAVLTQTGTPAIASSVPAIDENFDEQDIADLERYLDATKSNLLYARKVMLVEGPAELFLAPSLIKQVLDIDLSQEGVSVIPIYGIHFGLYARLFSDNGMRKKCAILTDGDLVPSDAIPGLDGEDDLPPPPNLTELENDWVKIFACRTTFERALVFHKTLEMFSCAAAEIGAPRIAQRLQECLDIFNEGRLSNSQQREILNELRTKVLKTSKRFGKARFAQVTARHTGKAGTIPKYISDAVTWLLEE